jgi:hypothetical protein
VAQSLLGWGATLGLAAVSSKMAAAVVNTTSSVDVHADDGDAGCVNGKIPGRGVQALEDRVVQRRLVDGADNKPPVS